MTLSPNRQALTSDTSDATGAINPYDRVKLYAAYGYGFTGAGVKVGVVDAGFNLVNGQPQHNEFSTAGKITVLNSTAPLQSDSHGAHVSALAVGDNNGTTMMGVAYGASLYLGMSPTAPTGFQSLFDEYRTSGVLVSSNSYGINVNGDENSAWKPVKTSSSYEVTAKNALAYRNAAGITSADMMANISGGTAAEWTAAITSIKAYQAAGGVVVWANSNYGPNEIANGGKGLDETDLGAALPLAFSEIAGGWITVVNATSAGLSAKENGDAWVSAATRKEGNIVLNSAPCGLAANFCLTMDGVAMWSASNKGVGSYEAQTGTSQATPQVAGMIAILRQAFPAASAADLAARLMFTADNRFFVNNGTVSTVTTASYTNANGTITGKVSDIWGHGIPDMQAALNPVGSVTVRSRSGTVMPLSSLTGTVRLGGALGAGDGIANTRFLFNDVLNGIFSTSFVGAVAASPDQRTTAMVAGTMLDQAVAVAESGGGTTLRFGTAATPDGSGRHARLGSLFSLQQRVGGGGSLAFGLGISPDTMLGFAPGNAGLRSASISDQAMGIPLLSLGSVEGRRWLAAGWSTKGVRATIATFGSGATTRRAYLSSPLANRGRTSGMVVDAVIGTEGSPVRFALSAGTLKERDGLLGSQASNGLFAASGTSTFGRVAVEAHLFGKVGLQGNYVTALTRVTPQGDGAFTGFSRLRSDAAAMAFSFDDAFGKGGRLTIGVAQPLRVAAGRASLSLPQGVTINAPGDYSYTYADNAVALAPGGREIDFTAEYSRRVGRMTLRMGGMVMRQPGNVATRGAGVAAVTGLKLPL